MKIILSRRINHLNLINKDTIHNTRVIHTTRGPVTQLLLENIIFENNMKIYKVDNAIKYLYFVVIIKFIIVNNRFDQY
jgi:hypothetical protein